MRPLASPRLPASLWAPRPADRLRAARDLGRRERRILHDLARDWPPYSPGAINAWLLLVTTKPPAWQDPLHEWPESPPTLGEPHPQFFYPDPLGFWAEVRRWAMILLRPEERRWTQAETLSVTAVLHVGDQPGRVARVTDLCQPALVLFLDEPSFLAAGIDVKPVVHHIMDPHRPGKTYEGLWATARDGTIVGKSPQHPTAHRLYKAQDMEEFLRSRPIRDDM